MSETSETRRPRGLLVALLLLLVAAPAAAEDPILAWRTHRPIADGISTALVGVQIAADTIASWRAPERRRAFLNQACRLGVVEGTTQIAKAVVHRTRPDGSDRKSFWSGHTAHAGAAAGWRLEIGIPITAAVGLLRGGADKHYLTDIGVGAVDAWLAGVICRRLVPGAPAERGP